MKKATNCSEYLFQKVFGIFIFLTFYFLTVLHAQDTREGKIGQDLNSDSEEYLKLGETKAECSEKYQTFCEQSTNEELLKEIRDSTNKGLAIGDDRFKMEVEKMTGRRVRPLKSGRPFGWRKEKHI